MKKLITVAVVGMFSTGMFANEIKTTNKNSINREIKKPVKEIDVIVNCEDGSSWKISCDSCSTGQLIAKAMQVCS